MSEKFFYIPQVGDVLFKKDKRSRKIKLRILPDQQVIVSLPFFSSYKNAVQFTKKNIKWIVEKQKKGNSSVTKFLPGNIYKTKLHTVQIIDSEQEFPFICNKGKDVFIYMPVENINTDIEKQLYIKEIYIDILRKEAKKYLPTRLEQLANNFGFCYNKLTIRNNRTNWGSCSAKNNINLNLHLMKLPDHLIDFIILHELVHTKIKNHSKEFYKLLNEITQNKADILAKEIKKYSTYTF